MTKHIPDLNRDLKIGKKQEKNIHSILQDVFNIELINTDNFNKFHNFDFVSKDNKIWVEHKYRGRYTSQLPTYFCDLVKYNKYKKMKEKDKDTRCFVVWTFSNCRKIWEMGVDNDDFFIEHQFRDRGKGYNQHTEVMNVHGNRTIKLDEYKFNQSQDENDLS